MGDRTAKAFKHYERMNPVRFEIVMSNQTRRSFVLNAVDENRKPISIDHFESDNRRYLPVQERDWDSEVTD